MTINIYPRQIIKILIGVVISLTLIHCGLQFLEFGLGYSQVSHIRTIFDFEYDSNLTTWYSSVTLLICSLLLSVITIFKKRVRDRFDRHWQLLAVIFAILSLDEVAMLHERAGNLIEKLSPVEFTGWLNFQWVLLGIPLTLIVAVSYLKFLAHLPSKTKTLFFLAGALYVGGGLGLEILAGYQESLNTSDNYNFLYELFTTFEELWEKLGVLVFIHALLGYMEKHVNQIQIAIGNKTNLLEKANKNGKNSFGDKITTGDRL